MRVDRMVRQLVSGCRGIVHASRLTAVVKVVDGIVRGGRLCPASVGRKLRRSGGPTPKNGIKSVDRLIGNPHLFIERWQFFRSLAARLLVGCARPVILVDWTQVMGTHQALVAAVPIGGRALPIYVETHSQKMLSNATVEEHFLDRLRDVLPPECRPIVVSDAGYKGPFFEAVKALGWDFLGRIRGTSKARPEDSEELISKAEFYARATTTPKDLGAFELFSRQRIPARLVLVRKRRKPGRKPPPPKCKEERELRQAALDPWLLATSVLDGSASYIVGLYAKRMQIEETFRDAKNHRFGWSLEDVRTACVRRAVVLLLLATLALVVVTLVGMDAERRDAHREYQANTTKRRVLSFFVLGCSIIHGGDRKNALLDDFLTALAAIQVLANA
jgi:hypothetical protein